MRTCARKLWMGWWVHIAFSGMKWLLVAGILLGLVGIAFYYMDKMAQIAGS